MFNKKKEGRRKEEGKHAEEFIGRRKGFDLYHTEIVITLGVLIFAGTNFREFFSPYIRGYLFSRMSFYSTFAGTNFREWIVSIANLLGKYVDE